MLYLNESDIKKIGIDWPKCIKIIEQAALCLKRGDFSQPLKPYLRYGSLKNRIIAMPAYVGGEIDMSGIKWIASFPDNIKKKLPRASCVVVLNDSHTGQPMAVINTALISIIRTASVTGLFLKHYRKVKKLNKINLGIIGWGPIGQNHLKLCTSIFGDHLEKIFLYDVRPIIFKDEIDENIRSKIVITKNWQESYLDSDIFITCTVSAAPYIDQKPKSGATLLNISLRDFKPDIYPYVKKSIIVDDWEEVCRENTDIEVLAKEKGLKQKDTYNLVDVVFNNCLTKLKNNNIMFNPMGLAVFDIAIASYYLKLANQLSIGKKV